MLAIANPSMRYVEGVAWSTIPAPIAHAWCIDESGRVVDTTWPYEASAEYFGVAFKTSFLRAYIYEMASFSVLDDPRFWRRAWDAVKKEPLPYWFEALAPFESESVPETTDDQ